VDTFAELFVDLARVALGLAPLSLAAWAYVTVLVLLVGPVMAQAAPRLVDPPARLLAADPLRVAVWLPLSTLVLVMGTIALAITIIGAVLAPLAAIGLALVGYLALAVLVGERLLQRAGVASPAPWLAALVGLLLVRLVRLVPLVGGLAHSIALWIGFAAATCIALRMLRSHWRRRLPDADQFRGETLVEWYPDGDPADGRPSVGTGRPVLDNVRGEEDR
jgi:hypothetical protein